MIENDWREGKPQPKKVYYLPVSITFGKPEWRYRMYWYKKDYNEYTKKYQEFYYPHVFVNPFVTGWKCNREKDFPQAKYIVSDSGGYQLGVHTKGTKTSCLDVLRWQENIADIGFTLDTPSFSYESEVATYRYYTEDHFKRCMEVSNKNAIKMFGAQENEKMELWAVIQGGKYDDLKMWYDDLGKACDFKGYCVPVASTSVPRKNEYWLSQLNFAKEVNTNFHFLGKCEPLLVATIAKLAQKTGKYYTYDTTSAATGLMLGKYTDPFFLMGLNFTKKKETVNFDMDGPPPCDCPVCQKHTVKEMITEYALLFLHNVYARKRFNEYIVGMVQDDEVFNNLLNKLLDIKTVYRKNKDMFKEGINNLVYDEPIKQSTVSEYVGTEEFNWE